VLSKAKLHTPIPTLSDGKPRFLQRNGDPPCHRQGCQIFLGAACQNGEKYANLPKIDIQNGHDISIKWPKNRPNGLIHNRPTSSIARPSKIYPNYDFWFENIPSGSPGHRLGTSAHDNKQKMEKIKGV
jgi:hypothetical protein